MNPLGVHFGMLKASDMILVNLNGDIVIGRNNRPVNAAGFLIHAAIHRARPDVRPTGLASNEVGQLTDMTHRYTPYVIRTLHSVEHGPRSLGPSK